jgi:SAM-dependent methyltransferase
MTGTHRRIGPETVRRFGPLGGEARAVQEGVPHPAARPAGVGNGRAAGRGRAKAAIARAYRYNRANRDAWVAAQAARVPAAARVLDVGAGVGPYRTLFAHCEYRTHDFAQEPQTLGLYTPLDYVSDIASIPVPDDSFDVVLCTEVLEHVPEPIAAVRELARILRPGGRLLLSAPLGSILHQEPFHFYGGYTPHWYRRFLPQAGLEVEGVEANEGFFSLFGQEAVRYSVYLDPRNTAGTGAARPLLTLLWLASLPFTRGLFPLLGRSLDRLKLEATATAGYHVVAVKRAPAAGARP